VATEAGPRFPSDGGEAGSLVAASQGSLVFDHLDPERKGSRAGAAARPAAAAL
jgi:hypothetical protein